MSHSFSVLGAGSWGAVMAAHLVDAGHSVKAWHFIESEAREMEASRKHPFLKDFELPANLGISSDLEHVLADTESIIVAVPSQIVRKVMEQARPILNDRPIINLAKGIEQNTLMRMSEVIHEVTSISYNKIGTLHGPSHAEEVMKKVPTTIVAASKNLEYARQLQKLFSTHALRVYANDDIIGVELGGSVKNVIAIAAGICDGIGFGDNTMAALVTRGLAEISRLGAALGAQASTFAGLSGIGDLIVTAFSRHSRNRYLGSELGKGRKMDEILDSMGMVAEGVYTAQSVLDLANKLDVEMPICSEVGKVLFDNKDPKIAITELMTRDLRDESGQ